MAMAKAPYQPPVSALLTYGSCLELDKKIEEPERDRLIQEVIDGGEQKIDRQKLAQIKTVPRTEKWPNYVEALGLTLEHVPELIRMATDEDLEWASGESLEVWAPVHAWRSLGQLKAKAAVEPLLSRFKDRDAEWACEEIPWVLGMIGESAIEPVAAHLANRRYKDWSRVSASESLERIALAQPELKERCVEKFVAQLRDYKRNPKLLNSFLVSSLIEFEVTDEAELIGAAHLANRVDETICGTWANVQIDLGLASEADFTPEELELPRPEWVQFPEDSKPSAFDLGLPTKAPADDISVVWGDGKLPFGKQKASKKSKGFGGGKTSGKTGGKTSGKSKGFSKKKGKS